MTGAIHIGAGDQIDLGSDTQTITMTNSEPQGVQYATQGPNGEIYIPVNLPGGGQAYQVVSAPTVVAKQVRMPSLPTRGLFIIYRHGGGVIFFLEI